MKASNGVAASALLAFALVGCAGADTDDETAETAAESGQMAEDPDIAPAGDAMAMPAGFEVRLDNPTAMTSDFRVMSMDGGMHIQTGPAGVFYNATESTVDAGNYTVTATFTEIGAPPNHREAYGLIIGGRDLQGPSQAYTYFLVRADGRYLIKKRAGEETSNVSEAWVESPAVNATGPEAGDLTNTLSIRVEGGQAHFTINGTEVTTIPTADIDAYGVAGARVNHNLNVQIRDWSLSRD
jgi:hypothetical protein